ncbi:MAG TPA: hypothetical protein VK129_04280 [Terriglobales bacterium]|nr:hypothetical protein [Terriglobales bacterium]
MTSILKPIVDILHTQQGHSEWLNGIVLVSGLLVLAAAAVAEWRMPQEQPLQRD